MSGSIYRLKCPYCGHSLRVRNSFGLHPLLRGAHLECMNQDCKARLSGVLEITHEMSPSSRPNPELQLPIADADVRREAREFSL